MNVGLTNTRCIASTAPYRREFFKTPRWSKPTISNKQFSFSDWYSSGLQRKRHQINGDIQRNSLPAVQQLINSTATRWKAALYCSALNARLNSHESVVARISLINVVGVVMTTRLRFLQHAESFIYLFYLFFFRWTQVELMNPTRTTTERLLCIWQLPVMDN